MGKAMSKSDLISKLADEHSEKLTRKDVKSVLESLATIGYKELKKSGVFVVPGFAKFVVIKKPATKERGHQPVHQGADDDQGEARPQSHQGPPGQGRQGLGLSLGAAEEVKVGPLRVPPPRNPLLRRYLTGDGWAGGEIHGGSAADRSADRASVG